MSTIASVGVVKESSLILFDPKSGYIVHVHHVVTLEGGKHPDDTAIARDAREILATIQPQFAKDVLSLQVPPDTFAPGRFFKVDPEKRNLVELIVEENPRRTRRKVD
jgi:hypothetical protein